MTNNQSLCKTCNFWKQRTLYFYDSSWWNEKQYVLDIKQPEKDIVSQLSPFGECLCDKFIYTKTDMNMGCVDRDDIAHKDIPDGCLYSDEDGYNAYFYTGESFGCVHYKKTKE